MNDRITIAERLRHHCDHNLEVRASGGTADIDCLDCNVGVLHCPEEYDALYEKWRPHDGHECEIAFYGEIDDPADITVECCDTVLCSAESDGSFMCPHCGYEFVGVNFYEFTTIMDHGRCSACQKAWQHGEIEGDLE